MKAMKSHRPQQIITTVSRYHEMLRNFALANRDLQVRVNLGREPVDDDTKEYELNIFLDFKEVKKVKKSKLKKPKAKIYGLDGNELIH